MPSAMILLAAMLLLVTSAHAASAGSVSPERAAELERLIRHDCGSCHGISLKGGLGPDLRASRFSGVPVPAIATVILDGIQGTAMPPWRPLLSDVEAHWIAAYLAKGSAP